MTGLEFQISDLLTWSAPYYFRCQAEELSCKFLEFESRVDMHSISFLLGSRRRDRMTGFEFQVLMLLVWSAQNPLQRFYHASLECSASAFDNMQNRLALQLCLMMVLGVFNGSSAVV